MDPSSVIFFYTIFGLFVINAATVIRSPYLKKHYILYSLVAPPDMLTYGLRDFIVKSMTGRPIAGTVNRAHSERYGQHIIVNATGTPDVMDRLEREVIDAPTRYWMEWTTVSTEERQQLASHGFIIVKSFRGATCGKGSDPKNDNFSEKMSSKSSISSKSRA
jgi:hypothetical protein